MACHGRPALFFIHMQELGRYFLILAIALGIMGVILLFAHKLPVSLGKLPGDIYVQKERFTFYFPLTTSLLISLLFTLVYYLFFRK